MKHQTLKLERKKEILVRCPFSVSTLYVRINDQLFPPPISIGDRAVAWVASEVDVTLSAMVAGKSKAEIKNLVASLIDSRKDYLARCQS